MSLQSVKEIITELGDVDRQERPTRITRALMRSRSAIGMEIELLEHELGVEDAFPVTIQLLRVSQDLTQRIEKERASCR